MMKYIVAIHRKYIILLSIMLSFCFVVRSQQSMDTIVDCLQSRYSVMPSEQIYLQTSKGIYETGEDIWFKGYQLDAQTMGLSDKSKTLYLQMIDFKDSVVWKEKYLIENGIVSGHVYVDEKLQEGDYFLEGYTKYSFYKNDTIGMASSRKIKIVKNISHIRIPALSKDSIFRFELFPEGGNLVYGILSKLAFKATDGKGNPVSIEGMLCQDGKPLSEVKSTHDGMGTILFIPLQGKKYQVELKNGKNYDLPEIHSEGMILRLSKQNKKSLDFIVTQSEGLPDQQIYLIGQMRGMVCCMAKGVLKDYLKITIPLNNFFYQGIAEFTLFNDAMQPIAERLVYVYPEKKLHIVIEPDKKSYAIREKATVKVRVTDEESMPVRANLGISIYDQAYDNSGNPVNILTHCYLLSQIRGKIYDPAYYFNEKNKDRGEALDLLLLTQGWRRYIWDMTNPAYQGNIFLTDEITGTQTVRSNKKNVNDQKSEQLIQVSGPEGNSLFVWTDSAGRFTVDQNMMKELRGGYVYLKPMILEELKPVLEINDLFSAIDTVRGKRENTYPVIDVLQYEKEENFTHPVVSQDSTILLDEITITGKGRKPFRDKFMGRLDSLAQKDLGPWVCADGWLENYKEGYTHHHDPRYCPCVVDDGEPRTTPVIGHRYHIQKNEYFQCNAKGGWCFKPVDSQWVIYQGAIYSEEELLRMNNFWRTKGYYAAREFYQPDEVDMQSSIPDARNTLLWEPSVVTDEKGEVIVSFYCSDINTGFTCVAEGVDGAGLLGTGKCEFRVIRK
ncbi:hypothetical protein AAA214_08090 [Parabacteroides goldsteinii]|uniref:hypothetical protein n=1 Tax=Parabacteroides TaxID=375288 RepID=UPI001F324F04|nr:hypothetical protein [Parabacteroides sp. AF17-3]